MSECRARPGKQLFAALQVPPAHEETGALLTRLLDCSLQHDRWWDEIIWIYRVLVRLGPAPHLKTTAKGHFPALQVSLWNHVSQRGGVSTALTDKQRKLICSGTGPSTTPGTLRNKDSCSETDLVLWKPPQNGHPVCHWNQMCDYDMCCNSILEHAAAFQL